MTEHPAWWPCPTGTRRVFGRPGRPVLIEVRPAGDWTGHGGTRAAPADVFKLPDACPKGLEGLFLTLRPMGPVLRFRNPCLWDSIATGVVRQVIRAAQSKALYRRFAEQHGEMAMTHTGAIPVFPDAERVLTLSDAAFTDAGMAFKRRPLRNAAEAYLHSEAQWRALPAHALASALQTVPGLGPWTAGAAAADFSNDWTAYPYGDLAVRTWAGRASPTTDWPSDDADFASRWRALAGPDLSAVTVLVLAWGSRHGDIG